MDYNGFRAVSARTGLRDCRVLVVDDAEAIRRLIGAVLAAAGISSVTYAADGVEALERVGETVPDLVILDIMMPRMDGFEVCRRLRADPRCRRLPILVETALGSPEERTDIFRAGATDVVSKPIHGPELIARVMVHLENRLLVASLENYQDRLKAELGLARSMQEAILPAPAALADVGRRCGLTISGHFEPSSEIGGDHWGLEDLGDGRVAVYTVDFTGHGVTAALNAFRLHSLMHRARPKDDSPAAYLSALNERLAQLLPTGQFATLLYGIVDPAQHLFTYASAAAPNPVVWDGHRALPLDGSGLPAGITPTARYENRVAAFPPGAALLLYSDALLETPDRAGNCLSLEDVAGIMAEAHRHPQPMDGLLAAFRQSRDQPQDDLTVVWLSRST